MDYPELSDLTSERLSNLTMLPPGQRPLIQSLNLSRCAPCVEFVICLSFGHREVSNVPVSDRLEAGTLNKYG